MIEEICFKIKNVCDRRETNLLYNSVSYDVMLSYHHEKFGKIWFSWFLKELGCRNEIKKTWRKRVWECKWITILGTYTSKQEYLPPLILRIGVLWVRKKTVLMETQPFFFWVGLCSFNIKSCSHWNINRYFDTRKIKTLFPAGLGYHHICVIDA